VMDAAIFAFLSGIDDYGVLMNELEIPKGRNRRLFMSSLVPRLGQPQMSYEMLRPEQCRTLSPARDRSMHADSMWKASRQTCVARTTPKMGQAMRCMADRTNDGEPSQLRYRY
jgi:hypothetical protein